MFLDSPNFPPVTLEDEKMKVMVSESSGKISVSKKRKHYQLDNIANY